jgi:hypothetical protein
MTGGASVTGGNALEDRRRRKRFDLSQLTVSWKDAADKDNPDVTFRSAGTLSDFSSRGLGVQSNENLKEGDCLAIKISYGQRQLRAEGKVVRKTRLAGRGFDIGIELSEADGNFIPNLLVLYFRTREVYRNYIFGSLIIVAAAAGLVLGWVLSRG